jgi:H+/Cl- antiporter ClcA
MAAAGLAGWLAARRNATPEQSEAATRAAITGAWSGLFTAPFTAVLLIVELNTGKRLLDWNRLTIDATAAVVGFAIFFSVTAGWSDVLRLLDLPPYSLEARDLAIAVGLGVLGAVIGTLFKLITLGTRRLAAPFAGHPIARCTLAGVALGLVGMALPLTLFLGTDGLRQVTDDPQALGTGLILVSRLVKLVATSGALSFGFVGGPVFPLFFAGGSLGVVVNDIVPSVPLALAVTASMAAVPASVIPVPFSLSVLTVLIGGVGPTEISAVFVAAVIALIAGRVIESALGSSDESPETVQPGPRDDST